MAVLEPTLPRPPENLALDSVTLHFSKIVPGDAARGFVRYYNYRIFVDGSDVGHVNFRAGDTEHVRLCAGHIGFEIAAPYRVIVMHCSRAARWLLSPALFTPNSSLLAIRTITLPAAPSNFSEPHLSMKFRCHRTTRTPCVVPEPSNGFYGFRKMRLTIF